MYEVIDLGGFSNTDQWEMYKNTSLVYRGSFKALLRYAIEHGFELRDFERAIQGIVFNGHNTLNFSTGKRLTSTSYTNVKTNKKTG